MKNCLTAIALLVLFVLWAQAPSAYNRASVPGQSSFASPFSRVILFSWDGVQYNHLIQLYGAGNLTNLRSLVNETSLPILKLLTTDHVTETNYAHPSLLSGMGQGLVSGCPDNVTIWENLKIVDKKWITGSVAGKAKFTNIIFPYANPDVDFWFAADASADIVTDLATSFIQNNSQEEFFLFVHYREPDSAGHTYGENSWNYDDALVECDVQMGRVLQSLESEDIRDSTAIIVTTDHGFKENGFAHTSPAWGAPNSDPDIYTTWIACSAGTVDQNEAADNYWDQNDVAPTIYSLMGIDDYSTRWPYIRGLALWHRTFQTRDISIANIQLSPNTTAEETLAVNVTIQNKGDFTEIPTITLCYDSNTIATKELAYPNYPPLFGGNVNASTQTITFAWNTSGVPNGTYNISAIASTVPGGGNAQPGVIYTKSETDTTDNIFISQYPATVVPEFPLTGMLLFAVASSSVFILVLKKKRSLGSVD